MGTNAALRPFGFNETVGMDLKYLKDFEENRFVALTIVDSGTAFQQACLLKTRDPKHVSEKFLETWITHYGCPRTVIVDQGGEFQSYFTQMLEDLGLESKVSGAHAPWQNALAERHNGILGHAFNSESKPCRASDTAKSKWP